MKENSSKEKRVGSMTLIANEMGYKKVSDVPFDKLKDYADNMTKHFGGKESKSMLMRQIIYRKNIPSKTKTKFVDIYEHIRTSNKNGDGIGDVVKESGTNLIKGISDGMGLSK